MKRIAHSVLTLVLVMLLLVSCAAQNTNGKGENPGDNTQSPAETPEATIEASPQETDNTGEGSGLTLRNPSEYIGNEALRISVEGEQFMLNGKRIWINGTNTPWNKWNEFGYGYDENWWNEHFGKLHEQGVNAVRVWINCSGEGAILIEDDGMISGAKDAHWDYLDSFFQIAATHEIYIMATLVSFDHFKTGNPKSTAFRTMLTSDEAIDSFVTNYTIPFVERYKDNPYLWSIDLCNEPDWIHESDGVEWKYISNFFARNAAAIHENSDILVTVGMGFPKYNSDSPRNEGNKVSDKFLQNLYDNENAFLDFWSPHYYPWVGEWYYTPFYVTPEFWGLETGRPALIGETAALGSDNYAQTYNETGWPNTPVPEKKSLQDNYESAYQNGWQGVMPWTSNGVDGCGGFDDLIPATSYMRDTYYALVFPLAE